MMHQTGDPRNTERAQRIPATLEEALDELHRYCDRTGRNVMTAKRFADRLTDGSLHTTEAVEITIKLLRAQDATDAGKLTPDDLAAAVSARRENAGLKRSLTAARKREELDRATITDLKNELADRKTSARHDARRIERLSEGSDELTAANEALESARRRADELTAKLERSSERLTTATTRAETAEKILDDVELQIKAQRGQRQPAKKVARTARESTPEPVYKRPKAALAKTTTERRFETFDRPTKRGERIVTGETKACTRCGVTKDLCDYYRNKRATDQRMSECKACFRERPRG